MFRKFVVIVAWAVMLVGTNVDGWGGVLIVAAGMFFSCLLGHSISKGWSIATMLWLIVICLINVFGKDFRHHPFAVFGGFLVIWAAGMLALAANWLFGQSPSKQPECHDRE